MKKLKTCCRCKLEKLLSEFASDKSSADGHTYQCKKCYKDKYEQNIEINRKKGLEYYHNNKEERTKKSLERYHNNKKHWQKKHKEWNLKNNKHVKKYRKQYFLINKEKIAKQRTHHYKENIDYYKIKNKDQNKKHKHQRCEHKKIKYKNDLNFKITFILRQRLISAVKNNYKKGRALELLGCTIEQLKNHLQQTAFKNGYFNFDINKYSGKEYNIDHIIPCAAFNLNCNYHQKLCFHWTNLQILEAKTNFSKHAKIAA